MSKCRSTTIDDVRSRPEDASPITPEEYTIGWICALPIEMAAAKGMLDKVHPNLSQQDPQDHNSYILGEIQGHNIVIAGLPVGVYGTTTAASVAKDLSRTFTSIRFGLMVGIGGGVPSQTQDIRLGDIVVSQPTGTNGGVIQYDRGKQLQQGVFERTGSLIMPPNILLTALARLQADHMTEESRVPNFVADLVAKTPKRMKAKFSYQGASNDNLYLSDYDHINPNSTCQECDKTKIVQREHRDDTDPYIHFGTIASGNQVIKDAKTRDQLGDKLGVLCFEMEAAGLQDFPCLVIRGICDYSDSHKNKMWQEYAAGTAAAFTKELLLVIPPDRVRQEKVISELVPIAKEQLRVSEEHRDISSAHISEHRRTNRILQGHLPIVSEACYDSADVDESPRCENNTRLRFRETISQWADQDSAEPIFWLTGPAGTGKSTLARTVADSLHAEKRLATSYFFKRGEKGRNDTSRLFTTLAAQLADTVPSFGSHLQKALDNIDKNTLKTKSMETQFDKLLWNPLSALPRIDPVLPPKVIIIDAFDECERPEHLERILTLLLRLSEMKTIRLRTLVTSRLTRQTEGAFVAIKQELLRIVKLHESFSEDTKADIKTFLNRRFDFIKEKCKIKRNAAWPSPETFNRLLHLATTPDPLFIYAATLCRFVYDEKRPRNPRYQLENWLKGSNDDIAQLNQIYTPVLNQVFVDNEERSCELMQFLRTIVLLVTPLPALSIGSLLGIQEEDIEWWIPELHAVLDIPTDTNMPIRILHKSFSDFLLGSRSRFRVDSRKIHDLLVEKCIRRMELGLKQDICDLREPGISRDDIDKDKISDKIPQDLKYACLHWFDHLKESGRLLHPLLPDFLYKHFLHWLEVLSLLGRIAHGELVLRKLYEANKTSDSGDEFNHFLLDAKRTISSFGSSIGLAPLQIYGSLLFFSPLSSKIRQTFWHQRVPQGGQIQGVKSDWDARLQTVGSHLHEIEAIAFSPDGSILASASRLHRRDEKDDHMVQLCNAITGSDLQTLDSNSGRITTMAFSPNSLRLALGCSDGSIRIWNMTTIMLEFKIPAYDRPIEAVYFSDNTHLRSVSQHGKVAVWNTSTGEREKELDIFQDLGALGTTISDATISPCTQLIAWCHNNIKIGLLNLAGGPCLCYLRDHAVWNMALAFSPDSETLAAASLDWKLHLWDVQTGAQKHVMDRSSIVDAIAFSPDGQLVAAGCSFSTLVWNVRTGTFHNSFPSRSKALAFSPDSQTLASGSSDIQLWDITLDQQTGPFDSCGKRVTAMSWSPNGQLVASSSADGTVQIWHAETGTRKLLLQAETRFGGELLFSSDSKYLACTSPGYTLEIWNMRTGTLDKTIAADIGSISAVDYSLDGQLIATLSYSSKTQVRLWQVATRKHMLTIEIDKRYVRTKGSERTIRFAKFSPDGRSLLVAAGYNVLLLWETSTGKKLNTLENDHPIYQVVFQTNGHFMALRERSTVSIRDKTSFSLLRRLDYRANDVCFSSDGRFIALVGKTVELWDLATGAHQHTLTGLSGRTQTIALSPNGEVVAVATSDNLVRIWLTTVSPYTHVLLRHRDPPRHLILTARHPIGIIEFSPDGQILATSSHCGLIRLWDVLSGTHFQTITCSEGFVRRIAFQLDELVVSLSNSHKQRFWNVWDEMALKVNRYRITHSTKRRAVYPVDPMLIGLRIDDDSEWIMEGSSKILWIPEEYRPAETVPNSHWIRRDSTIFIGCDSGSVIRFQLI